MQRYVRKGGCLLRFAKTIRWWNLPAVRIDIRFDAAPSESHSPIFAHGTQKELFIHSLWTEGYRHSTALQ